MPLGQMLKRDRRLGTHPPGPGLQLGLNQTDCPSRIPELTLAEKAGTSMYEDNEDRLDTAEQLAEHNPHAAAEAFSAIACDQAVGDEVRLSAAEQLAAVDPQGAAPACLAIARDGTVGDEVRQSAAEQLAALGASG